MKPTSPNPIAYSLPALVAGPTGASLTAVVGTWLNRTGRFVRHEGGDGASLWSPERAAARMARLGPGERHRRWLSDRAQGKRALGHAPRGFGLLKLRPPMADRLRTDLHVSKYLLDPVTGEWEPWVYIAGHLTRVGWCPLPGSQTAFLACTEIEVLYEGTRGHGKTIALLFDFAQHVGCGFGADWRGILFRRTVPQLAEVVALSKKWFKKIWPDAVYNEMQMKWTFPGGETLKFSHFDVPSDYDSFHGSSYPWIGWEELTRWPDDKCYKSMFSCSRSTRPNMPRKIRGTTNPSGVGHNWVMQRYRLPLLPGQTLGPLIDDSFDSEGKAEPPRRAIHGHLSENLLLTKVDPRYIDNIAAAARHEAELQAWRDGRWDIVAGGILDDLWPTYRDHVVVPTFDVPPNWRMYRSYDHGSSKPWAALWWAVSDGSDLLLPTGTFRSTVRGDLFIVGELYGWNGRPDEGTRELVPTIARRIKAYEEHRGWTGKRVRPGPADSSIFDDMNGRSIGMDFEIAGCGWEKADKSPGPRLDQLRKRITATKRPPDGYREVAGVFVCDCCRNWLRTVPSLPRDEKNPDDCDSSGEDHLYDSCRYGLRWEVRVARSGRVGGPLH